MIDYKSEKKIEKSAKKMVTPVGRGSNADLLLFPKLV